MLKEDARFKDTSNTPQHHLILHDAKKNSTSCLGLGQRHSTLPIRCIQMFFSWHFMCIFISRASKIDQASQQSQASLECKQPECSATEPAAKCVCHVAPALKQRLERSILSRRRESKSKHLDVNHKAEEKKDQPKVFELRDVVMHQCAFLNTSNIFET